MGLSFHLYANSPNIGLVNAFISYLPQTSLSTLYIDLFRIAVFAEMTNKLLNMLNMLKC